MRYIGIKSNYICSMLILASFALIALPYLFGKNAETAPFFTSVT